NSAIAPAAIRNSNKAGPDNRAEPLKVDKAELAKVVLVRAARHQVDNPSSSATDPAAIHRSNRADRVAPGKADLDRADLAKPELAKVAQDRVDRANSADKVPPARPDKAFPSKVARARKACPVRARPINSATGVPSSVRKVDESPVRKAPVRRAHKALSAST